MFAFRVIMKQHDFNSVIDRLRSGSVPERPAGIADTVMRRVRAERARNRSLPSSFVLGLLDLALRPQVAVVIVALTIALGVMTTAVASQVATPASKEAGSLGFEMIANPRVLECYHCRPELPERR